MNQKKHLKSLYILLEKKRFFKNKYLNLAPVNKKIWMN